MEKLEAKIAEARKDPAFRAYLRTMYEYHTGRKLASKS
jgi:hypothetical protein